MNIDFEKIKNIHGKEILEEIIENKEEIQNNINYLFYLKFDDIEDIFERVTPLFINNNKTFKNKINNLIKKIGPNYVEEIESNLGLLEEIIW